MNIVTHLMSGAIIAGPLVSERPLTAGFVILGAVLPDIDVLSRLGGKTSFLRHHQGPTHSLVAIAAAAVAGVAAFALAGHAEPWAPAGLALGMLLHALTDAENTYGAALWWPVSKKRYRLEWLFFIDTVMFAVTALFFAGALIDFFRDADVNGSWTIGYVAFLALYSLLRWALRRRAWGRSGAGTRSLIPSALLPWRFHGYALDDDSARLFELNALTGAVRRESTCDVLDSAWEERMESVPEFRLMRELSEGYHVVRAVTDAGHTIVTCRDLRTRNFGGAFGTLEVTFADDGSVERKVFHV